MQIIVKPGDWTKLTARALCHEPTQTLFILAPRLAANGDHALPDQITAHAYPLSDDAPRLSTAHLHALKGEAVIMILFLHGIIRPSLAKSKPRVHAT